MNLMQNLCLICLIYVVQVNGQRFKDRYDEKLVLKPMQNGFISSHFTFKTSWNSSGADLYSHYRLFPKALGEILDKYWVQELHLSLTQGLWRHRVWGRFPGDEAPPPGAQLWVWFKDEPASSPLDVDETWFALCNALSGLFCTSLNFIDQTNTICPVVSFRPTGVVRSGLGTGNSSLLRYAAIPSEVVCTENLTPWKKLLPCSSQAGIATLLAGRQLFDVHYHSLSIHVRPVCHDQRCSSPVLELTQKLLLMSEIPKTSSNKPHWSFLKLFGMVLFSHCPVSSTSSVLVDLSQNGSINSFALTIPPTKILAKESVALYDIRQLTTGQTSSLNVAATYGQPFSHAVSRPPTLHVNRYVKGYGRWYGIVHCLLHHTGSEKPLRVAYLEQLPSFAQVYAHTFKATSNGKPLIPDFLYIAERLERDRPFLLEAVLTLPPNSVTEVTLEFDRAFLKWNAYPPDANHGFYLGASVISTFLPSNDSYSDQLLDFWGGNNMTFGVGERLVRLYTEAPLLALPTPDFSMPYNVICLVCTVVAFAFGPLHNITTKRFTVVLPKTKKRFFFF